MIVVGIILLLPGLCALLFAGIAVKQPQFDTGFVPFIVVGLLAGALGVAFLVAAIRGPRS
jgi:hypothetical protein